MSIDKEGRERRDIQSDAYVMTSRSARPIRSRRASGKGEQNKEEAGRRELPSRLTALTPEHTLSTQRPFIFQREINRMFARVKRIKSFLRSSIWSVPLEAIARPDFAFKAHFLHTTVDRRTFRPTVTQCDTRTRIVSVPTLFSTCSNMSLLYWLSR